MATTDDLIEAYAEKLQRVYDNRTAGSYTFHGLLATFGLDLLEAKERETADKAPQSHFEPRYASMKVQSHTEPDKWYSVQYNVTSGLPNECECPQWQIHHIYCKHMQYVEREKTL